MLFALQMNIWVVLVSLGGYQLYLQISRRKMEPFQEGSVKHWQRAIGIPALANLIVFLFDPYARGFEFISVIPQGMILGAVIFNLAALMILSAHLSLGEFWSGELGTRSRHQVVETGLYRWIRHPLYTSFILIPVGLFLMTGDWLIAIWTLAYALAVAARAWKEEEMMLGRLGPSYALYMQKTGRFLPRFRFQPALAVSRSGRPAA
jgi:protein-S-isoprenylcysteine O-methyltransferase Ste14